jgi:uncharacterized protein (TIGR03435 family)
MNAAIMRKPGLFLPIVLAAASAHAQTPAASLPTFEVASIKPAELPTPAQVASGKLHVGMNIDAARVDIGTLSLGDLIRIAYRVKAYQVSGPSWMNSARFDIVAKMPSGATREQVPEMLQALLAERFKLTLHHESKEHAVYALVVGKGGSKLKESAPDADAGATGGPDGAPAAAADNRQIRVNTDGKGVVIAGGENAGWSRMSMGQNGMMHMEMKRVKASALADMLSRFVDRPVVDMTDLKGSYDVALDLSMEDLRNVARAAGMAVPGMAPAGGGADVAHPADAASDPGASIFAAVQELGLKLEPRKAPLDLLVIDHLEKTPTEN